MFDENGNNHQTPHNKKNGAHSVMRESKARSIVPDITKKRARTISRKSDYQVRINRLNAAMIKFIQFAFERDGAEFVNMNAEGMVTITAPFTKTGYSDYTISVTEGRALQEIIKESQWLETLNPLLIYKPGYTRWFLQQSFYRNEEQAFAWLRALNIDSRFLKAWRKVSSQRYSGEVVDLK